MAKAVTDNNFINWAEGFEQALNKSDIQVMFCEQFDEKSEIWNFKRHKHDFIEMLYFVCGSAAVYSDDTPVDASFYDIVIYPKGMYHQEQLSPNRHHEVICLWVDVPGLVLPGIIHVQDKAAKLKWLMESLHAEYKSKNPSVTLINYYVKTAAILISREYHLTKQVDDPVSRVLMYMQDHFKERITVEQLSDIIYLSQSYLSRIFRQRMGLSIMEYLCLLRIDEAKKSFSTSNASVEEVSYQVGYNSPKYFCRAFKKIEGISPREFKTVNKQKKERFGVQ